MKLIWMLVVILAAALGMAGGYKLALAGSTSGSKRTKNWCGWGIRCSAWKTRKQGTRWRLRSSPT